MVTMKMAGSTESFKMKNSTAWKPGLQTRSHRYGLFNPVQTNTHHFLQVGEFEKQLDKKIFMLQLHVLMQVWRRCWSASTGTTYTHTHRLYLLDIVACLCTGFNKQNIHLFCSLLSLLCGYLSAMSLKPPHKRPRGHTSRTWAHTQRYREERTQVVIVWSGHTSRALSCCGCCLPQSLLVAFPQRQKLWIWTEDNNSKITRLEHRADQETHQLFLHLPQNYLVCMLSHI